MVRLKTAVSTVMAVNSPRTAGDEARSLRFVRFSRGFSISNSLCPQQSVKVGYPTLKFDAPLWKLPMVGSRAAESLWISAKMSILLCFEDHW